MLTFKHYCCFYCICCNKLYNKERGMRYCGYSQNVMYYACEHCIKYGNVCRMVRSIQEYPFPFRRRECDWGGWEDTELQFMDVLDKTVASAYFVRYYRIQRHKKRVASAITIQRQWRVSISNPTYRICRNRLLNEFADMQL